MIAQNLATKIEGIHFNALRAFADRVGVKTTTEAIRRTIELLPEYTALSQIALRETHPSMEDLKHTEKTEINQEKNGESANV